MSLGNTTKDMNQIDERLWFLWQPKGFKAIQNCVNDRNCLVEFVSFLQLKYTCIPSNDTYNFEQVGY